MKRIALLLSLACFGCPQDAKKEEPKAAEAPNEASAKAEGGDEAKAEAKAEPTEEAKPEDSAEQAAAADLDPALLDPSKATEQAPDQYKVKFETTAGDFVVEVHRDWAPKGADRFYNLVKHGYYDDAAFFRAIEGFMVQFGIHGQPEVNKVWREAKIEDDPVKESNKPGYITFATSGKDSRTTQVFINFGDNKNLDGMGFAPFGKVVDGMDAVNEIHTGYGEGAPRGRGPAQPLLQSQGNEYLKKQFPELDYIKNAEIVES